MAAERTSDAPIIATGLGASPGLACGVIATSAEAAVRMAEAGDDVLLVRSETSPDDVHGMARSVGILTATGGLASHAAVVARGWDIPAVVGAAGIAVGDGHVTVGERVYREGEVLSIDGATGEIFGGPVRSIQIIVPEAAVLLGWARELGIGIGRREERSKMVEEGMAILEDGGATREDVIRALVIKVYVTADLLGPVLGVSAEEAGQLLDRLVADGIASGSSGMFSLTADGKALGEEMLAADRDAWGQANAAVALDGFVALDGRMKTVVTAWQMRTVDGQPVLNDHADAEYDARVLADLAALHGDAMAWIGPHTAGLPRLGRYARRLDAAAAAARAGDRRFVASPRVDSYHGVWFELHEELIRLAGRTREEEVAAGRA
jgi:pyruvate,orthophosphate dikinase